MVHKECVDETLSFTSDKIKGDSIFLIPTEVQVLHRVVQGVRGQVEVLEFSSLVSG
jgi:hypothetical protein